MLYLMKKDYAAALGHSKEAETLGRQLGDDNFLAMSFHQQGLILTSLAQTAQSDEERRVHLQAAGERFESSLEISRRITNEEGAAATLGELGKLWLSARHVQEAIAAFTEVLATYKKLRMPEKIGITLELLGTVHEHQGEYEPALEKYQQALEVLQQYGAPQQQAIVKHHIARVQAGLRGAR
jgi:tetratricopeptide (TPR) repeat protein